MKMSLAAALCVASVATGPILAQAKAEAPAASFSTRTPLEKLMADERAKAVLLRHFGGKDMSKMPNWAMMKAMSLRQIAPFSKGSITDELLAKIDADLAKIPTNGAR